VLVPAIQFAVNPQAPRKYEKLQRLPIQDLTGYGAIAQQNVDIYVPGGGQGSGCYRVGDGVGTQPTTDYIRPKFLVSRTNFSDPEIEPYNICYTAVGNWLNYRRHYPAGTYNVWGRLASTYPFVLSMGQVTSGVGTTNQTVAPLGTFTMSNPGGNQGWEWIPLLDANSNQVVVSLTGAATSFRTTVVSPGSGANQEFYLLLPAPGLFSLTATLVSGRLIISFPTGLGVSYQLQYKANLGAAWSNVGSAIPGTGSPYTVPPITPSGTHGYYQVVASE
jgi:hypothetical protein